MSLETIKTLYLIEDEPTDCMIAQRLLALFLPPIHLQVFSSVREAIGALSCLTSGSEQAPSLILLDINMPEQDGWDFIEQYLHLPQYAWLACKIVMLTSSIHTIDREKAKAYQVIADLLIKPFNKEQIIERLLPLLKN